MLAHARESFRDVTNAVLKRVAGRQDRIIDLPPMMVQAIQQYHDLEGYCEQLVEEGREAGAGGWPARY